MKGIGLVAAIACMLTGCAEAAEPQGERVEVTTLAMNAGGWAPGTFAAVSESPIHLGAFASWYGGGADGEDFAEVTDKAPPGSAYLAVTDNTGCRTPEDVQVSRNGDDLVVRFVGGADHDTCVRAVGPGAYLAVPAAAVEDVRTVNGKRLLDPAGPGTLVDNVALDAGRMDRVAPAEFGTEAATTLRDKVIAARPNNAEAVTTALGKPVPDGKRMFAFVVSGCIVEDAVLVLGPDDITAETIEPEVPVDCDAPAYFLTTFVVDTADVPKGITLAD